MKKWTLNSWRNYPVKHIPEYPDKKELDMVLGKLKSFPPLVFAGETRHLKQQLADVVDGKAFLLQGGDCAESFAEFHPDNIRDTFKVMLQMSLVLTYSASLHVVKLGRIAGQFSKPRSSPIEVKDGKELPTYLGDNINGIEFSEKARIPYPKRLFKAYSKSDSTILSGNAMLPFTLGGKIPVPRRLKNTLNSFIFSISCSNSPISTLIFLVNEYWLFLKRFQI